MQPDLLPPEEDQQTREVDPLEEAFDKPAIEDFRRNTRQSPSNRVQQAASFTKKNKKWIIGGTSGLAVAGAIGLFFFWMMLFKNVHIKNLYVTYRWAQFNRGINKSLKQELTKAKEAGKTPSGNADTTISEGAKPAEIIESANKAQVGSDVLDPANDADIERTGKKASSTTQGVESVSQEAKAKLSLESNVKPAANAEEAAKNVADDLAEGGEADSLNPEGKLSEATEDAKKIEESGKSAKAAAVEAAENASKGGSGFAEAIQKATGPFVVATFYCIFRDIYVEAKEQINQIVIGGASNVAQEVNKTADCQKLGECSLDQAGAVANKFDNDEESFTESCGYSRASQTDDPACKEINPQYTINTLADRVGGGAATTLKIADATLDVQSVKIGPVAVGPAEFCPVIMSSWTQGIVAVVNLGAIVTSGGGWAGAGQAVATGVGAAAATAGGKALIAHAILTYSGGLFKDLSPHDMGNLTDMGNLATASANCKAMGCVKVTPQQASALNREYRQELIAKNQKRSVVAKFFDTENSDSVVVRAALNTPTTPKAIVGRIGTMFASITNPLKLNRSLASASLALSGNTAMAAEPINENPYGIGEYVPANIAYNIDAEEADSFYDSLQGAAKTAIEETYQKCNNMDDQKTFIEDLGNQNVPAECTSRDYQKYAAAKFNQSTTFNWAIAHNNQSNLKGSVGGAVGGTSGSAEATNATKGTDTSNMKCPEGTADKGVFKTFNGVSIRICNVGGRTEVNASAAKAFYDMRIAAAAAGVTLDGGGFRSYEEQVRLRKAHCADWQNTPSRNCRPPTAKPGTSNHEEGLAVDYEMTNGVFAWLKANAGKYGIKNLPSERWHWSTTGG